MNKITMYIVGLALVLMSAGVALSPLKVSAANSNITDGMNATGVQSSGSPTDVDSVIRSVVGIMFFVIGALSVIMLIYGGIRYTTSGGNATSVTAAKNTIVYSIVGLVVAILAYAIVNFVIDNL